MDVKSTWIPRIEWIVFHGHLDYFQKPPLEGRPYKNRETMALETLITIGLFYYVMYEDLHA